jgi:nucleoside-diphosphate-sugar epimerase
MSSAQPNRRFEARTVLVTGGGGFLGKALVKALIHEGAFVKTIQRNLYPELVSLGVEQLAFDISNPEIINHPFFDGVTDVFHTAAKVEMWGKREDFFRVNVTGTDNLLSAVKKNKIKRFIFTSSPSVIASGKDLQNVDESIPYPQIFHAFYPETKAQAEQNVRREGRDSEIKTITLRPHLIYGPGDTSLEALIIKKAKAGRLVQVGSGKNLADFCHIDDCVEAHLCAALALERNAAISGNVYFISQGKPILLWEWIEAALKRNGLSPIKKKIPASIAIRLGRFLEVISKFSFGFIEPPFTRFLAEEMATDHYFDIGAARRDIGFNPVTRNMLEW